MYKKYIIVLSVGAFILNKKNQLLIVKKSSHEQVDAGLWTIPGGKIYPQEAILNGLKREVLEEVGLQISTPQWIGEDVFPVGSFMFHAEHFECKTEKTEVKLENKLTEYKWISSVIEMKELSFPVNIKNRIIELFSK